MKNFFGRVMFGTGAVILILLISGCAEVGADGEERESGEENPPWRFAEGRGIQLDARGKEIAGIELAEVVFAPEAGGGGVEAKGQVVSAANGKGTAAANLSVAAEKAAEIRVGSTVTVSGGSGGSSFSGRVERVDRQAAAATGRVDVIARLDDPEDQLSAGTPLTGEIAGNGSNEADVLAIPSSAVLATARGDFVYVVNGDHFFRSPVWIGRRSESSVEIVDGLFEGDVVASAGGELLWLTELQAINGGEACADAH